MIQTYDIDHSKFKYLKDPKSYNYMPEPFEEISYAEFMQKFFVYEPKAIEHRQIKQFRMRTLIIFWYHDNAYAILKPARWHLNDEGEFEYTEFPKYFKIGCNHDFKELTPKQAAEKGIRHFGRCYHVYECQKCGYIESQDSSD